jgi:hypothetical protein
VGPTQFHNFLNYKNRFKLAKSERLPCLAPKIPNFCMRLVRNIMHNISDCSDFKFQIETKLKILEHIPYLNFDEF